MPDRCVSLCNDQQGTRVTARDFLRLPTARLTAMETSSYLPLRQMGLGTFFEMPVICAAATTKHVQMVQCPPKSTVLTAEFYWVSIVEFFCRVKFSMTLG